MHGHHIATQPFNLAAFKPTFSLKYFSTTGLLIFAMSGAELAAPYVVQMRDPKHEFPKAMWLLAIMRSEEHTSELQSRFDLVCRLLLEKKNDNDRVHC